MIGQKRLDYVSENVHVRYVEAEYGSGVVNVDDGVGVPPYNIRLSNVGSRSVVGGKWAIYFNHASNRMKETADDGGGLALRLVDGCLFALTLLPGRVIGPFSNVTLRHPIQLLSRSHAFPRWYLCMILIYRFCPSGISPRFNAIFQLDLG